MEYYATFVAFVAEKDAAAFRKKLKQHGFLDTTYISQKTSNAQVAVSVTQEFCQNYPSQSDHIHIFNDIPFHFGSLELRRKQSGRHSRDVLLMAVKFLCENKSLRWSSELEVDLPRMWEKHGDMLLLPSDCFTLDVWQLLGMELWQAVASAIGCGRVAKKCCAVSADDFRSPNIKLLLGSDAWVEQIDNGIRYSYDITRCMFSAGNITEKLRIADFDCCGEVVVDLYAGIGYFTLPYLVHAGASHVYACEWNPHAVEALQRNLHLNSVFDRCTVLFGDNRQTCPANVANRVNLGLLPTSESGWLTACAALRQDLGGVLHVHATVNSKCRITSPSGDSVTPSSGSKSAPETDHDCCESLKHVHESSENKTCKICEQSFTGEAVCRLCSSCQHRDCGIFSTESSKLALEESKNHLILEQGSTRATIGNGDSFRSCSTAPHFNDRIYHNQSLNVETNFPSLYPEKKDRKISGQAVVVHLDNCSGSCKLSSTVSSSNLGLVDIESVEKSTIFNKAAQSGLSSATTTNDRLSPPNPVSVSIAAKQWMTKFLKTCSPKPVWCKWADSVCRTLESHLCGMQRCDWSLVVRHIEHVKSYAPHVDHIVADIECRPPEIAQN